MGKFLTLLAALLVMAGSAHAQLARVSGEVLDQQTNEPIIGATVRVDGTAKATVTDVDGKFTFTNLTAKEKKITVTYVGYEKKTVDAKANLQIYIVPVDELMDELIVVAFGKQKRESFTGAATVIKSAEIEKQQVSNPVEALNGRVAGMQMLDSNNPTSSVGNITIRGVGSLKGGTAPLYIVDGLPYSGNLNDINPADVESMTVLKDAASNALYGARGSNGVILITTKSAERGNTKLTVNAKWGGNTDGRTYYDYIDNPGEYYELQYLALKNSHQYASLYSRDPKGVPTMESQPASVAHILANQALGKSPTEGGLGYMVYTVPQNQFVIGENGRLNPNATLGNRVAYNNRIYTIRPDDWVKEGTRTGLRQEYNVNLSGGSDKFTWLGSVGYFQNNGIAYNSKMERWTARLKTTFQPYPFLKVGANAAFNQRKTNGEGGGVFGLVYSVAPVYPLYLRDADGNIMYDEHGKMYDYGNTLGLDRPVEKDGNTVQENELNLSDNNSFSFNIQGFATLDFLKYFHLTANVNAHDTEQRWVSATNPYYGYYQVTGGSTSVYHERYTYFNTQQMLNYNQNIGEHSIDVLVGHEYTRNSTAELGADKTGMARYEYATELNSAIINGEADSSKSFYNVEGYFMRAQYDYKSKYFANASYRLDGSSRFHPDHRWGNFWSLGGAWIISKEDFWPKNSFLNMLKYKISYGIVGNDNIGNYKYTDTYSIKNVNDRVAFMFGSKGNENIRWEKVGNFNTGLEFELFGSRLSGGIDYYYRKTSDMLTTFYTPYEIGYSSYYDNIGDMVNQGVELTFSATPIAVKNFTWDIDFNLTCNQNRVTYIPEKNKTANKDGHAGYADGMNYIGEGLSIYTWYLKRYAGVNEYGQALYYRKNSDGTVTTTTKYDEGSYFLCDKADPKVYGGFSTNFKIFDFDLAASFNYSIGGKKYDNGYANLMGAPYGSNTGAGYHRDLFNAWTPENPDSNIPMFYYGNSAANVSSDRWLINASYLSLRNLSVGYTVPRALTNKIKMRKVRVYASCENVAYWTKRKGFDPRIITTNVNDNTDLYSPMRTIIGGIQIEL